MLPVAVPSLSARTRPTTFAGAVGGPTALLVVRPESGLFYANADNVRAAITADLQADTVAVVLDLAAVPVIDISAAESLATLADDLNQRGIELRIARDIGQVRDLLERAGAGVLIADVHPTVEDAVGSAPPRTSTPPTPDTDADADADA